MYRAFPSGIGAIAPFLKSSCALCAYWEGESPGRILLSSVMDELFDEIVDDGGDSSEDEEEEVQLEKSSSAAPPAGGHRPPLRAPRWRAGRGELRAAGRRSVR